MAQKEVAEKNNISKDEYEHIKKYRDLDPHGKEMVDFTLLKEWERSTADTRKVRDVVPIAVREDTNYVNAARSKEQWRKKISAMKILWIMKTFK